MNHAKWWSSNFAYWHVVIHTTQMEIFLSCCLHINSFNVWLQVLQCSSIKRGSFELPYSFLFGLGLAHIDETRGLKRVYETAFGLWFGEYSNFKSWKKSQRQGMKGIERHELTWGEAKSHERTGYVNETKTNRLGFFTSTTPLRISFISFLGPIRFVFAHLTWGLIDLKLFPIQGIFQLKMPWLEIKRKWQGL